MTTAIPQRPKTAIPLIPDGQTLTDSVIPDALQVQVLENGNLQFSIAHLSASEWNELYDQYESIQREELLFGEVFEQLLHEKFFFVPEIHYPSINALTNAPILSDYDFWNAEESEQEFAIEMGGLRLWWYPRYEVKNAFEELLIHGIVIFESIPNE